MAFLDNSGDIILDAVLTDAGRKRMSEGNFAITNFALGDDEIDYSLYNNQDSRGSAYYDIDILSTPILEAFTDNMSGVKSKLMTITKADLLYLPVIKINGLSGNSSTNSSGSFYVAVNEETWDLFDNNTNGVLDGKKTDNDTRNSQNYIQLHQGIDNEALESIDSDLIETSYIIEIDNRFGQIVQAPSPGTTTQTIARESYVDDDDVASYILTNASRGFITPITTSNVIAGPTGTSLQFTIFAKNRLRETDYLMQRLGGITSIKTTNDCYFVDLNVRVTGVSTGYRVDIPVRFLKRIGS